MPNKRIQSYHKSKKSKKSKKSRRSRNRRRSRKISPTKKSIKRRKLRGRKYQVGGQSRQKVIVFDFDCTLTSFHMWKTLAAWDDYREQFDDWCTDPDRHAPEDPASPEHGFPLNDSFFKTTEASGWKESPEAMVKLMKFGKSDGDDSWHGMLKHAFKGYFMGGSDRFDKITAMLTNLKELGYTLNIMTNGYVEPLSLIFKYAAPEWQELFSGGWIADSRRGKLDSSYYRFPDFSHRGVRGENPFPREYYRYDKVSRIYDAYSPKSYLVMIVDDDLRNGMDLGHPGRTAEFGNKPHIKPESFPEQTLSNLFSEEKQGEWEGKGVKMTLVGKNKDVIQKSTDFDDPEGDPTKYMYAMNLDKESGGLNDNSIEILEEVCETLGKLEGNPPAEQPVSEEDPKPSILERAAVAPAEGSPRGGRSATP
ncbi:MAG: hypothetical protein CL926_13665, partial [Deltaproteobacteria bacterium]|nr:hypothetical protein [Deltaproteobacteria bacterium]